MYEQTVIYKRDIILNYLSSVGKYISHCAATDLDNYGFYYARSITLISNENTVKLMINLHQEILKRSWKESSNLFYELISHIKEEI